MGKVSWIQCKKRGIIDPKKYGEHCRIFIEKMKAVDPNIKIGLWLPNPRVGPFKKDGMNW